MSFSKRAKTALDLSSTLLLKAASAAILWNLLRAAPPASPTPSRPRTEQVSGVRIDAAKVRNSIGLRMPVLPAVHPDDVPDDSSRAGRYGKATYITFALPLKRIHPNAKGE